MLRSRQFTAAFAANKTSTAITVPDDAKSMAVCFPALDAGNLIIQGSVDGTNYFNLHGKSGDDTAPYTFTATTGSFILPALIVGAVRLIQFTNSADVTGTITVAFM